MKKETLKKYLPLQTQRAKQLGMNWVVDIELSPLVKKKYRVILRDGSHIDYGALSYSDYLQHKDQKRRIKYHQRFHNNKGYNDIDSALYYSARLLW